MGNLGQDLRYAFRTFRKAPFFVAVAVLSLALGIGANTAIFSLVDQLLLRLLPVKNPQQLVLLWGRGQHYGSNTGSYKISYPMYEDFRDHAQVFSGIFCRWETSLSVSSGGKTERLDGELVSGTYFPVLGVGAALGRVFTPDDDKTPGGHPFAVISYRYWVSRFGAKPDVIGKKLLVDGYPFTIVGVSQAGFDGTDPGSSPQIRIPIMMEAQIDPQFAQYYSFKNRRTRWVNAFGRLKSGVSMAQAKAGLQPLFHQILEMETREKDFARADQETKRRFLAMWMELRPASKGESNLRSQFQRPLLVLTAVVGLVLLIACANVANLLIARATARRREIAVRLALGASRSRIISQLLVESLTLSLAGGAAGLALAVWMDRALLNFLPTGSSPLVISTTPDWRILLFTLGVSVVTGIIFGLVPALQSTRPQLAGTLKDQVGSIVGGTSVGLRKVLVSAQVTLSLLLLIGAGLFIRSLKNLKDLDPGFHTANLIGFQVDPPMNGYKQERSLDFYRQLRDNLNALPGVESSALAVMGILTGNEWDSSIGVEGFQNKPSEAPDPHMQFISPDYFKTMNVPILLGRDFRMTDGRGAPKVCIVNERFARQFFKDGLAVGRHIGLGGDPGTKLDIEIVGVVRDTKYESMRDEVPLEIYQPYHQMEFVIGMFAYVRTARQPEQAFSSIRQVVNNLDPNLPVFQMKTIEAQMEESLITERLVATLSTGFGILATLLAAIGLYGVMAYMVAQRTREIGVRMALGASSGDVLWLVMKDVVVLAGIGIAVGLPAAWALTRLVKSQLYGIQPNDTFTIVAATLGIACVALLAGYVPARKATRVEPMLALRWE
ncbi:MAG TPA: ABC transporter permease [Bryobacteraceae bacterium]|jgi:predicted permease|nr:ABC transporter permease [Bryobacteraceae bacterium]